MTDQVKVLSDDALREIEERTWACPPNDEWLGTPQESRHIILTVTERDALCATVRASDKRTHTPSIVEALRLLDDAGYGKEVPNSLSDMIKKVLAERDDLLNRSHQTVLFDCGCMFKQEGLDAEPMLIVHCAAKEQP